MTQKKQTEFIMIGGLPGAGKSTIIEDNRKFLPHEYIIISSDAVREEVYGSAEIQGDNSVLFDIIHSKILENLSNGSSVVFDATNLSRKHRVSLLQKVKSIGNVNSSYHLIATSFSKCLERNENRERKVPTHVIKRMRESFNVPLKSEGWDNIFLTFDYDNSEYNATRYINQLNGYNQQNPHHSHSLGEHMTAVQIKAVKKMPQEPIIFWASLLHDCGKPYTKTFRDKNGILKETASYYNHENVGAYESLFFMDEHFEKTDHLMNAATLIEFHMRPYFAKSEKAKQKIKNLIGEDLYYMLEILHEADKESH